MGQASRRLLLLSVSFVGAAAAIRRSEVAEGFVKVDSGSIHYNATGSGCPVVFLGGGSGMDHRQWEGQFAEFRDRFRLIGVDPRGVGRSSLPTAPFSYTEDLLAVLDTLQIEKAIVAGLSFAGGVAIDFALAHANRVHAIVAAAPAVSGYQFSEEFNRRTARLAASLSESVPALLQAVLDDPYFIPAPENPAARERAKELIAANVRSFRSDFTLVRPLNPPALTRLGEIGAPVLLALGDQDHPDLYRIGELLAAGIGRLTRVEIPNAGHTPQMENPAAFNRSLDAFLNRLSCN